MSSENENYKTQKVGVTALCRISAKGGEGIYLYIPRNFAVAYNIVGADFAEINFRKLFRKIAEPPEVELCAENVRDWTNRKKKELGKDNADFMEGEV